MVKRVLLLLFIACIPGRHPVVGTACDLEHPCPDDLLCDHNVCVETLATGGGSGGGGASGGAGGSGGSGGCNANRLTNGGFEQHLTVGVQWSGPFSVQGATVRSGAYAAKLTASSPMTVVLQSQLTAISAMAGSDHCAEAWVRATGASGPIGLQLARWAAGPDLSAEATITADGTWQKVTQRFAYPSGNFGLTVQVNAPLGAGGEAFVDDVCVSVCP